ncbi:helix-turn-helix domain-containing protein [Streptomyces xiamenensis]
MRKMDRQGTTDSPGPIGAAVQRIRASRQMTVDELAVRADLGVATVSDLEGGRGWVASYGSLIQLADALGVSAVELSGRPVTPGGQAEAELLSTAFFVRRVLVDRPVRAVDGRERTLDRLLLAESDGDESDLATELLVCMSAGCSRPEMYTAGAGLLRRLGYVDLAWLMLHRARAPEHRAVLTEEARLLLELGRPGAALIRAGRAMCAETLIVQATAHAFLRNHSAAHAALEAAAQQAESAAAADRVLAARASVALELGRPDEALDHIGRAMDGSLPRAQRYDVLVVAARVHALLDRSLDAAEHLDQAHGYAPLRFASDPLAREVLHHLWRTGVTTRTPRSDRVR